jgi:hypothetical protein
MAGQEEGEQDARSPRVRRLFPRQRRQRFRVVVMSSPAVAAESCKQIKFRAYTTKIWAKIAS